MTEAVRVRTKIVECCKWLHQKDMLAAADGNISFRISNDEILITPTALNKAFISEKDIAVITIENKVLFGQPSGERWMHLEVYKKSPLARAVVHAHPPHAIAWSLAYPNMTELPNEFLSEVILATGRIPVVPYARPGTREMGSQLPVPQSRTMILSRHGALSWGEGLQEAYDGMERIEHSSKILKLAAELVGGFEQLQKLPASEVDALWSLRRRMGDRTL